MFPGSGLCHVPSRVWKKQVLKSKASYRGWMWKALSHEPFDWYSGQLKSRFFCTLGHSLQMSWRTLLCCPDRSWVIISTKGSTMAKDLTNHLSSHHSPMGFEVWQAWPVHLSVQIQRLQGFLTSGQRSSHFHLVSLSGELSLTQYSSSRAYWLPWAANRNLPEPKNSSDAGPSKKVLPLYLQRAIQLALWYEPNNWLTKVRCSKERRAWFCATVRSMELGPGFLE